MEDIWIPLKDGRRLAARLWLPEATCCPVPAILEYLPYRKRDGTAPRDVTTYSIFAEEGYAGVRVDTPGNGDSDGYMPDEYIEDELASGEEVIAWIAAQAWCDGSVGMIGISWGGFNGLQIAMRRPPALRAIVTANSTVDRYHNDVHYLGGCPLTDNFNWSAQMAAYSSRPPDPLLRADWREVWMQRLQRLPFLASNWLRHQRRDVYWKHGSVCEDWDAIQCATLAIGGWFDCYQSAPQLSARLSAPFKALVGPWEHRYPHLAMVAPRADFHGEVVRWFDRWLKGADNGADKLPAYRAYIQEHDNPQEAYHPQAGRWVGDNIYSLNEPPQVLCLQGGVAGKPGGFGEHPDTGLVTVQTAQHLGDASGYFCAGMRNDNELPDEQSRDDALSVCFERTLSEPLEILGAPTVDIEFSVDKPQAMLVFRLCDVAPDGVSQRVSYMAFNLCHRDSDDRPTLLQQGERYRVTINLRHCGHHFRSGHTLRLAVSTTYWAMVWPSPENAAVTLHLENCRLQLPVRPATDDGDAQAPAAVRAYPTMDMEHISAPTQQTTREQRADGTLVLSAFDDFGEVRLPEHGLQVASQVRQTYSIHPDNPLSARTDTAWRFAYGGRENWHIVIELASTMSADGDAFYLTQTVTAHENGETVFDKHWDERIARDHT